MFFNDIFTIDKAFDGNEKYEEIERIIEKNSLADPNYINNLEMKCYSIVNGGILDFNITIFGVILSYAAFFISLFGDDVGIKNPVLAFIIFFASGCIFCCFSINLHKRKCIAQNILFVIGKRRP